jgi:ferredoxin
VRTLVDTYTAAGGRDPVILLHAAQGAASIAQAARHRRGLPSAVIPVEVHHVASVGLDLWLAALASGASRIAVLAGPDLAPSYREAIEAQMRFGETIANALGYQGEHFRLVDTDPARFDDALWRWAPPLAPRVTATFAVDADKRTTLAMAIEHLARHAPTPQTHIPLPGGAPFGAIEVAASACTMCLACVGACPVGALADGQDTLELRFIESRCVQCGICEATCPEHAITLRPGLCLEPSAKALRVLNAARVAACTRCGKALGAAKLIDDMVARLATHSMFATPEALARLRMCADCRVIDQFAATAR